MLPLLLLLIMTLIAPIERTERQVRLPLYLWAWAWAWAGRWAAGPPGEVPGKADGAGTKGRVTRLYYRCE